MNILKWLGRGLLLLLASLSITLWISVTTLQMTLLNREAVFSWLNNSGAYASVGDSIISLQQPESGQAASLDVVALQTAISKTLSAEFTQHVTETVLGAAYDWLQGKTNQIDFSVPLSDKREELKQHLATELEPKLRGLPACSSNLSMVSFQDLQCLSPGSTPKSSAEAFAKQAVDGSDFLSKPLTPDMLGINTESLTWLPPLIQLLPIAIIGLPVLALTCIAGYILLSASRLSGARTIFGRLFFGAILSTLGGAVMWYFGSRIQLADALGSSGQVALVQGVVQPIIHQVLPAFGSWVTILAGSVALITGGAWGAIIVVQRRKKKAMLLTPPPNAPTTPEKPTAPPPTQTLKSALPKPTPKKIQ